MAEGLVGTHGGFHHSSSRCLVRWSINCYQPLADTLCWTYCGIGWCTADMYFEFWLTNYMGQAPCWEARSCSDTTEVPLLGKPMIRYSVYKNWSTRFFFFYKLEIYCSPLCVFAWKMSFTSSRLLYNIGTHLPLCTALHPRKCLSFPAVWYSNHTIWTLVSEPTGSTQMDGMWQQGVNGNIFTSGGGNNRRL